MHKSILLAITVLALTSLACGISINFPLEEVETGPDVVDIISIPAPQTTEPVQLTMEFGAGKLTLSPGAGNELVAGTATYNVPGLKPEITSEANSVRLSQGDVDVNGLPDFSNNLHNEWVLQLGKALLDLEINAGAYKGEMDLGGLALNSLAVTDGASESKITFSSPNLVEMQTLSYETGASKVELMNLGNANFSEMLFHSGVGDYTLNFEGSSLRASRVDIETGLSNIDIVVPLGVNAEVVINGALTNIDIDGQWEGSGKTYSLKGEGPRLVIHVDMGAGNLELRNP